MTVNGKRLKRPHKEKGFKMKFVGPSPSIDAAAFTAVAATATTWLVELNDILQIILTIIGIVTGVLATWCYWEKLKKHRNKDDE